MHIFHLLIKHLLMHNLIDGMHQNFGFIRLGDKVNGTGTNHRGGVIEGGIAAGNDNFNIDFGLVDPLHDLMARHLRHHQIKKNDIDIILTEYL